MARVSYRFVGMNNKKDPTEITPIDSGNPNRLIFTEMVDIADYDCDDAGKAKIRRGTTQIHAPATHSGWSDGDVCLFVENSILRRLNADSTVSSLTPLRSNNRMIYDKLPNGVIYTNGVEIGLYANGATSDIQLSDTREFKTLLPPGQVLRVINGRVFCASGTSVLYTDTYSLNMDSRKCQIPFKSLVTMIQHTDSGIFVSDQETTYWHNGVEPTQDGFKRVKKDGDPALLGGSLLIDAKYLGLDGISGQVAVWFTTRGFCIGTNSGEVINITQEKVAVSAGQEVTLAFRKINGFHQLIAITRGNTSADNIYTSVPIAVDTKSAQ